MNEPPPNEAATSDQPPTGFRPVAELQRLDVEGFAPLRTTGDAGPSAATVARWLEGLATLHTAADSIQACQQNAARFVVDTAGLDAGILWRLEGGHWRQTSCYLGGVADDDLADHAGLEHLRRQPATWLHGNARESQADEQLKSMVVAPLRDEQGRLLGALQGVRAIHDSNGRRGIRYLEANLVRLAAESVSAAIIQAENEAQRARTQALFEQAFAPAVAKRLMEGPEILQGTQREVTVLFADMRGFSTVCQSLSTPQAYELLTDVMNCLTEAVMQHQGVVIDYYGDGLAAMWNAPLDQPGHPDLACRAALKMLDDLPNRTKHWQEWTGGPVQIGLGLHTGIAQVGNAGSAKRLKYGPRGATVIIANRVESATRELGVPLLATAAVADRVQGSLLTHRVCRAQLDGVQAPMDLFAIRLPTDDQRISASLDRYQSALTHYEQGNLVQACQLLSPEADEGLGVPSQFLAEQVKKGCCHKLGRRREDASDTPESVIDLRGE